MPAGTYRLTPGSLSLPVGARVQFSQGAVIKSAASAPDWLFNCLGRNLISGGSFVSPTDDVAVANVKGGIADVVVSGIACSGCRILMAMTGAEDYPGADDTNSPSEIRVCNCVATGKTVKTRASAIFLGYCRDSAAWGNRISAYLGGIVWWGGDAAKHGIALASPRKCRNLQIFGNFVSHELNGGIWGSMGRNVSVFGNAVESCADVCVDFEGCIDCVASGNTITDGVNGCLATYYSNSGIVLSSNVCSVSDARYPLVRVNNVTLSPAENVDIIVTGNSLSCTSGGTGLVSEGGPFRVIEFSNNMLRNVCIAWDRVNNFNAIRIRGNTLTFDVAPGAALPAIDCCGGFAFAGTAGQVQVSGNRIISYSAASGTGISVATSDHNGSSLVSITDNEVRGFATDIATTERGTNPSLAGTYIVARNLMGAGTYARRESGKKRSRVRLSENYDGAGGAVADVRV